MDLPKYQDTALYSARTQYMNDDISVPDTISRTTEVVDFRDPIQVRGALARAETVCRKFSVNSPECFLARDVAQDAAESQVCWQTPGLAYCGDHIRGLADKYGVDWTNMCGRGSFAQQPAIQNWLCSPDAATRDVRIEDAALRLAKPSGRRLVAVVAAASADTEEMFTDEGGSLGVLVLLLLAAVVAYGSFRLLAKKGGAR